MRGRCVNRPSNSYEEKRYERIKRVIRSKAHYDPENPGRGVTGR